MTVLDHSLAKLQRTTQEEQLRALAFRFAPIIRLDAREPFRPLVAGYTIFRRDGPSPSFDRQLSLRRQRFGPRAATVIEYAIWWDWDINHLYELEHIWVYLNDDGEIIGLEGSWHGEVVDLVPSGRPRLRDERPVVLASPGKHAFAPTIARFQEQHRRYEGITTRYAGGSGIALNRLFAGKIWRTPPWDRLIHTYLSGFAFSPSWKFSKEFTFKPEMLVPWPALREWIPERVHVG